MKKISIFLVLITSIIMSPMILAAANPVPVSGYYSTKHPGNGLKANKRMPAATDITIFNASQAIIYARVPNSPIDDEIFPNTPPDHIYNDTQYDDTYIEFLDPYRNIFFGQYLCRHAVVTITGRLGSYQVNVDRNYC